MILAWLCKLSAMFLVMNHESPALRLNHYLGPVTKCPSPMRKCWMGIFFTDSCRTDVVFCHLSWCTSDLLIFGACTTRTTTGRLSVRWSPTLETSYWNVIALRPRCTHVTLTTRHRNLTLTDSSHFHTRPTHTSHWPHHVRHRNLTLTLSSHFHTRPTEISILHHILEDSAEIAVPITVARLHCIGSRHKPKCRLFHLFGVTWNSTWITYR